MLTIDLQGELNDDDEVVVNELIIMTVMIVRCAIIILAAEKRICKVGKSLCCSVKVENVCRFRFSLREKSFLWVRKSSTICCL